MVFRRLSGGATVAIVSLLRLVESVTFPSRRAFCETVRPRRGGHTRSMSEQETESGDERGQVDPVVEEQAGKGYGEDEGERDDALEQQNFESL